nr:probable protein phosphatase 2C 47 [Arachis hypogaea]
MGHMFGDSLEKKARLHAIATFVVGFWILSVANNMLQGLCWALLVRLLASKQRRVAVTMVPNYRLDEHPTYWSTEQDQCEWIAETHGLSSQFVKLLNEGMLIGNAGDSRAVLGKRGRAIELSKDHKPNCTLERLRIDKLGGVIYDGYLNGQLSVARALGDWHIKGSKGSKSPLSAEPELEEIVLTEEDELISTMKV